MNSKVLVIDDDQAMCELIEDYLRVGGADVTWRLRAEDAHTASSAASSGG